MTCKDFHKKVRALFDRDVPVDLRRALQEHARTCDRCSREIELLNGVWDMLGELPGPSSVPDCLPGVVQRINRQERMTLWKKISDWQMRFRVSFAAAAAGAMTAGFAAGFGLVGFLPPADTVTGPEEPAVYYSVLSDMPRSSLAEAYAFLLTEEE